jgi:hypothetical protein
MTSSALRVFPHRLDVCAECGTCSC